jgi:hypothetical protein
LRDKTGEKAMKYKAIALLAAGMAGVCLQALADDAPTAQPQMTHKQMMKDCITKERAAKSSASDADLKKTCEAKIKEYRDHPSVTTTPANTPPG